MKRAMLIAMVLTLSLLTLASPGLAYKKVKCFNLQSPEQVLAGIKRIAILDFDGKGGHNLSDFLVSDLIEDDRGIRTIREGLFGGSREGRTFQKGATTKIFEIVERSRLSQVMNEQKLGQSGVIDNTQAANLGKVLGVDAIIIGSVNYDHKDDWTQEARYDYVKKTQYTVACLKRTVTATARMRVVSVETGQIIGSKESIRKNDKKQCGVTLLNTGDIPSVEVMADGCFKLCSWELANYMSPCFDLVEMELYKVKVKEHADKAEEAANAAEKGDLDKAYMMYYAIYQKDAYNPELLYNLGILNEAVGNYSDAKEMYSGALSLKSSEDDYQKAVRRIEKALAYTEALKAMGVSVTRHEWNTSESAIASASVQKIRVKGGSEERQDVKQEPQEGSAVVTRVPGGIELVVLKQQGDWFLVQLLGGKQGFLHKSQVK